jgi:hypothetical protein
MIKSERRDAEIFGGVQKLVMRQPMKTPGGWIAPGRRALIHSGW